jgi:hypothetical protein
MSAIDRAAPFAVILTVPTDSNCAPWARLRERAFRVSTFIVTFFDSFFHAVRPLCACPVNGGDEGIESLIAESNGVIAPLMSFVIWRRSAGSTFWISRRACFNPSYSIPTDAGIIASVSAR